ncbi:flagellar assembly protein FliH [Treponema parvum]|uniref:Flagellar assembly protein FliH n=1 Tax=Treponema parvum TaxID=138851 RepID=A0A975F0B5_9SPIR|nr:flagellar assembly protein FliH [Treponema parvum]QTQ12052.1 flagellar assembly protein FliH [Treponema parvum]QTQ15972.1 flagellar assembly protein FliH [Treponema parvum]
MAKTVFRPNEIKKRPGEVMLKLVHSYEPKVEEVVEEAPVYEGPTVEDLKREADEYRARWEDEKKLMLEKAQAEAAEIVSKAKDDAFSEVKKQSDQAQVIKTDAQNNAAQIIKEAQEQALKIIDEAHAEQEKIKQQSSKEGYEKGHEDGYVYGKAEADRLVERMHTILTAVMQRREEILQETEQQIVELVILMARKVVKVLSENQKNIIMNNVLLALKKVKGRGDVILRVNLEDVKMTAEHTRDFIERVENIKSISVIEDSSVERGGCIVETDFGAIDARISSQLKELEDKILEVAPIKTITKSDIINPDA